MKKCPLDYLKMTKIKRKIKSDKAKGTGCFGRGYIGQKIKTC